MRLLTRLVVAASVAVATVGGSPPALAPAPQPPADPLPASCNPFGDLGIPRSIDMTCGLSDAPSGSDLDKAQNRVKNNLCATAGGAPVTVTRFTFDQLQNKTPAKNVLPWGARDRIPTEANRSLLKNLHTTTDGATIGEGSFAQFVAFILEGHYGGKEMVNCEDSHRPSIDIHLALVTDRPTSLDLTSPATECTSVTAETIPHRRPIAWETLGHLVGTKPGQKLTGAQVRLADQDLQWPVRIRGQLLFDASHSLCANGAPTRGNPARRTG
jgi:hypothetical protein